MRFRKLLGLCGAPIQLRITVSDFLYEINLQSMIRGLSSLELPPPSELYWGIGAWPWLATCRCLIILLRRNLSNWLSSWFRWTNPPELNQRPWLGTPQSTEQSKQQHKKKMAYAQWTSLCLARYPALLVDCLKVIAGGKEQDKCHRPTDRPARRNWTPIVMIKVECR